MRILVLGALYPPGAPGGYELGCRDMVNALADRGHDLRVLCSGDGREEVVDGTAVSRRLTYTDAWSAERNRGLPVERWHARLLRGAVVDEANIETLRHEVESFRPDLVYMWQLLGVGGLALALTVEHRGLPWVWHLMDRVPLQLATVGAVADRRLAGAALRRLRSGVVVSCSGAVVDDIERRAGAFRCPVRVLPNWVTGAVGEATGRVYRRGATLRCVTSGRLVAEKGVHIAIAAVGRVRDAGYDIVLDVIGDGPARRDLEVQAARQAPGSVTFAGHLDREAARARVAEAHVLVFPTWDREPFAFAPLEASAEGCVPLVTAASGNGEWMVDGVHLLTANRHPGAVAAALEDILEERVDLAALSRRGRNLVAESFRLEPVAARVEAALEVALRGGGAERPVAWTTLGRAAARGRRRGERAVGAVA